MTDDHVRDDDSVQTAVRNLLLGSAPEREVELALAWAELEPKFQLTPDQHQGDRVILDAGAYRYVRFNHRVLRAFWIAAFAAWEAYRAVAETESLEAVDLTRFKALVSAFEIALASDDLALEPLPPGVPAPGHYPEKETDPQGRATAELATIAAAWALLHEVRHIRHQREGTGADPQSGDTGAMHAEEFSCDEFATRFLWDQIDDYCRRTGEPAALVRQKRQLGIYLALFALVMLAKDNWRATTSHPGVQTRINAVRQLMARQDLAAAIAHVSFAVLGQVSPGAPNPF
jgi:hypothetical protein